MATQVGGNDINSTGALSLVNARGTVATHDTDGRVTNPERPWFKYHADSAANPWTTYASRLVGSGQVGNCFDLTSGRFTAPVDGIYQFNMSHITQGNHGDTRVQMNINGTTNFRRSIVVHTNGPHHNNSNMAFTTYLAEGDYVEAVNSSHTSHAGNWNHFSGYYVGEFS